MSSAESATMAVAAVEEVQVQEQVVHTRVDMAEVEANVRSFLEEMFQSSRLCCDLVLKCRFGQYGVPRRQTFAHAKIAFLFKCSFVVRSDFWLSIFMSKFVRVQSWYTFITDVTIFYGQKSICT
jgi:hypothetical protein